MISTLHKTYCDLSGLAVRLDYDRERAWHLYLKAGFTVDDLKLVLAHLRYGVKKGVRFPAAMGFTRLIWGLDVFEEELVLARAEQRNKVKAVSERERVLKEFRGPPAAEKPGSGMMAGDLAKKLIADMRKAAR